MDRLSLHRPQWRTGEYRERAAALDKTVQQRVPRQRMVRSSRSEPPSPGLALPYQDARSQPRPTSHPVLRRNVGCQENSPRAGLPFAEERYLRSIVRVRLPHREPCSRRLQVHGARCGERTLRCPKLLQPSWFSARKPNFTTVSFDGFDVKAKRSIGEQAGKSA